ncbi:uncharacterized protein KRP23_13809 [Phytophthora ramorum]|uniref:uncharacterized protein n=1 Tax=Phytophthora ramorum TaxID=164328 RepID=UPI0030A1F3B8|nr:hypothetical protein KRP23_13809 [Phytophthora ramorum]
MDQTSDMTPHSTIEFVGARTVDVVQSTTPDYFRSSARRQRVANCGQWPCLRGIVHDELKEDMHYDWDRGYYTVHAKAHCDKRVMIE